MLGRILQHPRPYALLGYPDHANVGDSAIWLGTLAALAHMGWPLPRYACDRTTYCAPLLRARLPEGPLLLLGGGSLGDLWPETQAFRERVCMDFPDREIVQLPQSIHFGNVADAERARNVFRRHARLRLLVRDRASLARTQDQLGLQATLCPDLAAFVDAGTSTVAARVPVLHLERRDHEAVLVEEVVGTHDVWATDWPGDARTRLRAKHRRFRRRLARAGKPLPRTQAAWERTLSPLATRRVDDGLHLLARGSVVLTDRLHGWLLAAALGRPVVLLPSVSQKAEAFAATWEGLLDAPRFAASVGEGLRLARACAGVCTPGSVGRHPPAPPQ